MSAFIMILAIAVGGSAIILPWINRSALCDVKEEIRALKRRLSDIEREKSALKQGQGPIPAAHKTKQSSCAGLEDNFIERTLSASEEQIQKPAQDSEAELVAPIPETPEKYVTEPEKQSLEQKFGRSAFVWAGSLALALAGIFLVKYSIEAGLLSPFVRVVLGALFGVGLLFAGTRIHDKETIDNGKRIGMALSGAGIADLYGCLLAATNLYDLIPAALGFIGMAAVTAVAIIRSLRHGRPIALLGLAGGFLTPVLIGSHEPHVLSLFLYLYFLLGGISYVARRQKWWGLRTLAVVCSFLWVAVWLFSKVPMPFDVFFLGVFLLASCATVIGNPLRHEETDEPGAEKRWDSPTEAQKFALVVGTFLMSVLTVRSGFSMMSWALYGFLAAGSIALAYFKQELYGKMPQISMIVTGAILCIWPYPSVAIFAIILTVFAALYGLSSYAFQLQSRKPAIWAGLFSAMSLSYYLIAYFRLRANASVEHIPLFWGGLCLAMGFLCITILRDVMRTWKENTPNRQFLAAIYAGTATAFLSLGLAIEIDRSFLALAFATEILALSIISLRLEIDVLRKATAVLGGLFAVLTMPEILQLASAVFRSDGGLGIMGVSGTAIVHFGFPAFLFAGASIFLRRKKDDFLVALFETGAVLLLSVTGYLLTHHFFLMHGTAAHLGTSFVARGAVTNLFFALGTAGLLIGRKKDRQALSFSGAILCGLAALRIFYFDYIVYNPLFTSQDVGSLPIVNALLLTYGLPVFWTMVCQKELALTGRGMFSRRLGILSFVLAFTFLTYNVRQIFHGAQLNQPPTTDAEIYIYSVVWLLFGLFLLAYGARKEIKAARTASIIVIALTIGKVFLYDASALTGLWRVFSFAGLGLSLLGLSWFYTRFVSGQNTRPGPPKPH